MTTLAPSIFEANNARTKEPGEVAKTFVPPELYRDASRPRNTLIIGPRGSGKTTLLKMLQPAALAGWDDPAGRTHRDRVRYTGIFVPTDVSWQRQLEAIGHGLLDETASLLSRAAFTTHVLMSTVEAMQYRVDGAPETDVVRYRRVTLDGGQESAIVRSMSRAWLLEPPFASLMAVHQALRERLGEIYAISQREVYLADPDGQRARVADAQYLFLDAVAAVAAGVEAFDSETTTTPGRWALLFDELELAPQYVLRDLLALLRSTDRRLLFKLALSPYSPDAELLRLPQTGKQGHDFDVISLSYPHKEDGYLFTKAVVARLMESKGISQVDPDRVLHASRSVTHPSEWSAEGTAYGKGSKLEGQFRLLFESDDTFREYLESHDIRVDALDEATSLERAKNIRKITSLVDYRNAMKAQMVDRDSVQRRIIPSTAATERLRSAKVDDIYAGASSLYAMTEGNPRWIIGIFLPLIEQYCATKKTVSANRQAREVKRVARRFLALLSTISARQNPGIDPLSLADLFRPLWRYFFWNAAVAPFTADPVLSFRVDSAIPADVRAGLGVALNAGAIVMVDDSPADVIASVEGHRFRISYLLAAEYRLPLVLGRGMDLSELLAEELSPGGARGPRRRIRDSRSDLTLWLGKEVQE